MRKFFLLNVLAIFLVMVAFNNVFAFIVWVDAHGKPCDVVCKNKGLKPVIAGTYINGEKFYVCSGNAGGEGLRPGYNLRPGWADRCVVGWGGRELSVRPYKCLCESEEYKGTKVKKEKKAYKRIFYNGNIYACSFTDTSRFTLNKPAYVHKLAIWYKWSSGEKTVSYILYHNGNIFLRGEFKKGSCDPYQRMWCSGEDFPERVFPKGNYVLKVSRARQCQNAYSNHNGFVEIRGYFISKRVEVKKETRRKQNVFYYPKIKGYRLDWCRLWGTDCGKGAADAFCRLKGYTGAESWEIDPDIGLRSPTYVIGSGQICNQSFCDGFKYIVCSPKKSISNAVYLGCYKDQGDPYGTRGRDLSGYMFSSPNMTTELCISECRKRGFAFAGTQYGSQCFCGNSYGKFGPANNCNMPCSGNKSEICGGFWANSIYKISVEKYRPEEEFEGGF